tara:strand:+ start:551 stop:724 length:174 start_codon:yes stop_codon:yes gene_type:complete
MREKFDKKKYLDDLRYRQYRSNQGRSPERMEKIYKGCFVVLCAGIVLCIVTLVCNLI